MNIGKEKYDNISIPKELDSVIWKTMRKEERGARTKKIYRRLASVAAILLMLFVGANVPPVYAYASQIPIIGTIAQVFHIHEGGQRTDGAYADAWQHQETVEFGFESSIGKLSFVPSYSVVHLSAPNRMILTLQGVRSIDCEAVMESFLETEAVQDVYRAMIGDDSLYSFVIVLNSGYTYSVTEYENPGLLKVDFFTDKEYQMEAPVYYLRSEAMPYGESLGLLWEIYYLDGATQLKTLGGDYIVTIGQYRTEEEALMALKALEEKYGNSAGIYISEGLPDEIPLK